MARIKLAIGITEEHGNTLILCASERVDKLYYHTIGDATKENNCSQPTQRVIQSSVYN